MPVRGLTAFLDFPAESFDRAVQFWLAATGTVLSGARGEHGEFATLLPPGGTGWLRVQRTGGSTPGVHLDVHTDDPVALCMQVAELGAVPIAEEPVPVRRSPGGLAFCVVSGPAAPGPVAPEAWGRHHSVADQVCLDIPPGAYAAECAFWSEVLDRTLQRSEHSEFHLLDRPAGEQLRVLLQRLDEPGDEHAHLDLATDDREAEAARLVALGAAEVRRTPGWTVLHDPAGMSLCVTDRDPWTGS